MDHPKLPEIVERWTDFSIWLLKTTDSFPRKVRGSLVSKLDGLALEVLDDLHIAAFQREKAERLASANLGLTRLRLFLRLANELGFLSSERYERACAVVDEVGRMLGGWMKAVGAKSTTSIPSSLGP
jgi:hypothetical protein